MKYVVVGTSHAGYEAIETLLKEDSVLKSKCLKVAINLHSYPVEFKVI